MCLINSSSIFKESYGGNRIGFGSGQSVLDALSIPGYEANRPDKICPMGSTPLTPRYLLGGVKNVLDNGFDLVCRRNYIIVITDGNANAYENILETAQGDKDIKLVGGTTVNTYDLFLRQAQSNKPPYQIDFDFGTLPAGYSACAGEKVDRGNGCDTDYSLGSGIAYFSQKLFNADLKQGGVDAQGIAGMGLLIQ